MASNNTPIAIIGMACRFSGDATSPEKLWELLASGRSGWSEIPESRFATKGLYHPNKEKIGFTNVRGGHFLTQDPAVFDASFFNFSHEVARTMDPQHRLTLEIVYEAMESAGITMSDFEGSDTSVYAGCMLRDYHDTLSRDPDTLPRYFMTSNAATMASNRVSHFYDLRGPSMTVDTGCSTTLTALHLACQNLRAGESGASVVTGASLMLNPDYFVTMSSIGFLSPDGVSYAFDDKANGYGRGEGVAAIILKRLDDAVAAGDPIRAIIRGTALNQDGKTVTITTPCQRAQEELIRSCYREAGIDPAETGYVEAHGTGTPVGDPIELGAISTALDSGNRVGQPLLVGSVKAAIGHTEAASGLASVIKVAMSLEKGLIPPNCNFGSPNRQFDFYKENIRIPTTVQPWPTIGTVRRASINNFGFGGANAHVILEEYQTQAEMNNPEGDDRLPVPNSTCLDYTNGDKHADGAMINGRSNGEVIGVAVPAVTNDIDEDYAKSKPVNNVRKDSGIYDGVHEDSRVSAKPKTNGSLKGMSASDLHISNTLNRIFGRSSSNATRKVFVLRGKDRDTCLRMAADLREHLLPARSEQCTRLLEDLAYTLGECRSYFPWVAAYPAHTLTELIYALGDEKFAPVQSSAQPRIGLVFNGQGAQWYAMGRELMHAYPVYAESIIKLDGYLRDMGAEWSLVEELSRDEDTTNVHNLVYSLPLCTAIQIALVDLLRSWSVNPVAVTGHSSGEVAAAYAAHALDARSAIAIPYLRGALSAKLETILDNGGMMAVGLGRESTESYLSRITSGKVTVACVNSQNSVTVSGDISGIVELEHILSKDKVFCRRLRINGAFHSEHMSPISAAYVVEMHRLLEVKQVSGKANVVFSSSVTGKRLPDIGELATPEYWNANMLGTVEFAASFRNMCFSGGTAEMNGHSQDVDVVIEVGPHGSLGGPIQDLMTLPEFTGKTMPYFSCLVRKRSAIETMQLLACDLLRQGYPIATQAVNFPAGVRDARVLYDLPSYPWDHNTRFELEPRANKAWRKRDSPYHELLGTYQSSSNSYMPTWRNIIRISDLPWLRDHIVMSNIVFPGAGYLCMAIEAVTMLSRRKGVANDIVEYQLSDVQFVSAMIVPEDSDGRDVQTTLLSCNERSLGTKGQWEFRISSVSPDNIWTEHCKGLVNAVTSPGNSLDEISPRRESSLAKADAEPNRYSRRVDPEDVWAAMRSVGICHGAIYRNLKEIVSNRTESVATFSVVDASKSMPMGYQGDHIIHPTTLDSVFQAAYSILPGLGTKLTAPYVPRSIKRLRFGRHTSNSPGHKYEVRVRDGGSHNVRTFRADMTVFDAERPASEAVVEVTGLLCQSIDGGARDANRGSMDRDASPTCNLLRWAPDLSFPMPRHALSHLRYSIQPQEIQKITDLKRAVLFYIHDAVNSLTEADIQGLEWHHAKHYQWMRDQLDLAAGNKLDPESSSWLDVTGTEKSAFLAAVSLATVNGEMIGRIGPHIAAIMRRETTALELMLENDLLFRFYPNALKYDRSTHQIAQLVKMLAHKNPRARILEIGAGTGSGTQPILETLGLEDGEGVPFEQYDFTDVSAGFFETARTRFEPWEKFMTFRKLDIESDPSDQGFASESYDIIVACQVLHATKSMENTMRNVRRLLKPGGHLALIETTNDGMDVFLSFGLLPGEETERKSSPSLTSPYWDQVLCKTGFTGLDYELRDCENDEFYNFSVIISTATLEPAIYHPDVVLVCGTDTPPLGWLHRLQDELCSLLGALPRIEKLHSAQPRGKTCIYLGDVKQATALVDIEEVQFAATKVMATTCNGLLWVTRGGCMNSEKPEAALSHGLLRTLRHEYPGKSYVTLDIDPIRSLWTSDTAEAIFQVFSKAFNARSPETTIRELEFCERGGTIHVPRIVRDSVTNAAISKNDNVSANHSMEAFTHPDRVVSLHIGTQGLLDSLVFVDDTDARVNELAPDFIELSPKAFGLNFRDIMVAMGQIRIDKLQATECAGIITGLGSEAEKQGFKIGDRVCALLMDDWTSRPRAHVSSVVKISDKLSFEIAAAVPTAFATAYISLHEVAKVQKGETVLIHSAAGGLGQAAIMLCQQAGAVVYATVGSQRRRDYLTTKYNIPESNIFSSRHTSFSAALMEQTGGKGVNIVLNSLAGPLLQESFDCLSDFGRFIELGKRDFEQNSQLDMASFRRNTAFHSVDLIAWESGKQDVVSRVLREIVRLLEEGLIAAPDPITTYPVSHIEQAFRFMQTGQHIGKIAIIVDDTCLVPIRRSPVRAKLDSHASYVIVGGMGGIGRSICEWMVDRGAKHLIVLSRNAKVDSFLAELLCEVRAIPCDVSDIRQLSSAIASCEDMPPVRGVLQAAMVLQDCIFEQMTSEGFRAAIAPKAQGSWNLHTHFTDLDFFIILSSVLGVTGSPGQANYTAGGAFEDALARFRRSNGLPAVCIDLGVVQSVGYVAGNHRISKRLTENGIGTLQEEEVHLILDAVISQPSSEQIITSIRFPPSGNNKSLGWLQDHRFAALRPREGGSAVHTNASVARAVTKLRSLLSQDMNHNEVRAVVLGELSKKIMSMFGTQTVDASKDLVSHGVDSLVAIELRNWLAAQSGIDLSILDLVNCPSLTHLSTRVANHLSQEPRDDIH